MKLQIRDRNGRWHTLLQALYYIGGRGYVPTFSVEGYETCYDIEHVRRFVQEGTVRKAVDFNTN